MVECLIEIEGLGVRASSEALHLGSAVAQCLRLRDCRFEPHRCHCVVSLSKTH